ncbi:hypothetical protein AB664_30385 [Brucella anthropi]|uniref:Uncharacterized protein n=1 Tax=Brucella anthropi TaxID=529 RepID=A0A656Z5I3_BRUAN|nr:hypothetical protein AB664_30385 [Brucella anthropi]
MIFGIRPEALTDPDGADRNASSVVEGDCLIDVVEPAGSDTFAVTRIVENKLWRAFVQMHAFRQASVHAWLSISTRPYSSIRKRRPVFCKLRR